MKERNTPNAQANHNAQASALPSIIDPPTARKSDLTTLGLQALPQASPQRPGMLPRIPQGREDQSECCDRAVSSNAFPPHTAQSCGGAMQEASGTCAHMGELCSDAWAAQLGPLRWRWDAQFWARKLGESKATGRGDRVYLLHQVAHKSTQAAIRSGYYNVEASNRSTKRINLDQILKCSPLAEWFGRSNVDHVPGNFQSSSGGKLAPPVVFGAMSTLDTAVCLHRNDFGENRVIVIVAEIHGFDQDGEIIMDSHGSLNPECLALRSDFSRFVNSACAQLRDGKSTVREHLCANKDPYVFLCRDVTIFRGTRDLGYPFLAEPLKVHVVVMAMSESRPAPQLVHSVSGWTEWYQCETSHTALLERLNLVSLVVLQEVPKGTTSVCTCADMAEDDSKADRLPVILLPSPGAGLYPHPRDAVANSLKHWRRHFTACFHTAFVCTAGRGMNGHEGQTATYLDEIVNFHLKQILESCTPFTIISKLKNWHWNPHINRMSANWMCLEQVAGLVHKYSARLARTKNIGELVPVKRNPRRGSMLDELTFDMAKGVKQDRRASSKCVDDRISECSDICEEDDGDSFDEEFADDVFDTLDSGPVAVQVKLQELKAKEVGEQKTDEAPQTPKPDKITLRELRRDRHYRSSRRVPSSKIFAEIDEPDETEEVAEQMPTMLIQVHESSLRTDSKEQMKQVHESSLRTGSKASNRTDSKDQMKQDEKNERTRSLANELGRRMSQTDARRASLGATDGPSAAGNARRNSIDTCDLAAFIRLAKDDSARINTDPASENSPALPGSNLKAINEMITQQKKAEFMRRKSTEHQHGQGELLTTGRPMSAAVPQDKSQDELAIRERARKELMSKRASVAARPSLSTHPHPQVPGNANMARRPSGLPFDHCARSNSGIPPSSNPMLPVRRPSNCGRPSTKERPKRVEEANGSQASNSKQRPKRTDWESIDNLASNIAGRLQVLHPEEPN